MVLSIDYCCFNYRIHNTSLNRILNFFRRIANSYDLWRTSGSYAGATLTTKIFSIIQTALINVEKYLNYVFENINKESIDNNYHIQLI